MQPLASWTAYRGAPPPPSSNAPPRATQAGAYIESVTPEELERPLHFAARSGDLQIVEQLLEQRADPLAATAKCVCAPAIAARGVSDAHPAVHQMLYKAMREAMKARSERFPSRQLAVAAGQGDEEEVRRKYREGADPDSHDGSYTALQLACLHDRPKVVNLLLEFGAEVNLAAPGVMRKGVTALHVAGRVGSRQIAQTLLDAHADPTAEDDKGQLPAQVAHMQLAHAVTRGCMRLHAVTRGHVRSRAVTWGSMWSHADTLGHTR